MNRLKRFYQNEPAPMYITDSEENYFAKGSIRSVFTLLIIIEIIAFLISILSGKEKDIKNALIIFPILGGSTIIIWIILSISYKNAWKYRLRAESDGQKIYATVVRIEEQFDLRNSTWFRVHVEYDDFGNKKKWTSQKYCQDPSLFLTEGGKCRLLKYGLHRYIDRNYRTDNSGLPHVPKMTLMKFHKKNKMVLRKKLAIFLGAWGVLGLISAIPQLLDTWYFHNDASYLIICSIIAVVFLVICVVWPVYSFIKLKKAGRW